MKPNNKAKTVLLKIAATIYIIVAGYIFLSCLALTLFDGWCAGGDFCSRCPGIASYISASISVAIILSFVFISKKVRKQPFRLWYLLLIPTIAAVMYVIALAIRGCLFK